MRAAQSLRVHHPCTEIKPRIVFWEDFTAGEELHSASKSVQPSTENVQHQAAASHQLPNSDSSPTFGIRSSKPDEHINGFCGGLSSLPTFDFILTPAPRRKDAVYPPQGPSQGQGDAHPDAVSKRTLRSTLRLTFQQWPRQCGQDDDCEEDYGRRCKHCQPYAGLHHQDHRLRRVCATPRHLTVDDLTVLPGTS